MATKMYCDIDGEEIIDTQPYFSLVLTEHNKRGHPAVKIYGSGGHETVAREVSDICKRCATKIATAASKVERAEASNG